ncbi:MAG: putative DNA binding domain-containing protein [Rhabdochlamydiaceae bacterium]|nr:putative DNA binding domain-containing protein [Rhabdochlamydiaceae bacterium]
MKTLKQIENLLAELDHYFADDLETQDLDFKKWDIDNLKHSVDLIVDMAICMANGGGGTVVFGIADKVHGRSKAILGIPLEVDVNRLKKAVYDRTDPKITPVFEELCVSEGTGRLLVMQIYPGIPPYTNTSGGGTIRIGKDCQPLTGTLRRKFSIETGETDYTASTIQATVEELISPTAMEKLRTHAGREKAPADLLRLNDRELLQTLGLIKGNLLTHAGLLIAGNDDAMKKFLPGYRWSWLKMESDTRYSNQIEGRSALPIALERLEISINMDNPITTLEQGLFHFEYRIYPEIAIREALLNAFCHADFQIAGPIMAKQYADRLEISNNGGFIAGITANNILHHPPASRNPLLVEALTRLRLVNRSNLGISRIYEALLIEGKEPPCIRENSESIAIVFLRRDISPAFRLFVAEESQKGRILNIDHLLILQHLLGHLEMDTLTASKLCQRDEGLIRDTLSNMERWGYLEHGGSGRGVYWTLDQILQKKLDDTSNPELSRRISWEAAKTRILSILMERAKRNTTGLSNQEIRKITLLSRFQAIRLMKELIDENPKIANPGKGRNARYNLILEDK